MNIKNSNDRSYKNHHFVDAIIEMIEPTHFITLSLCQRRAIPNDENMLGVSWLKGDDSIYTKMHERFVESLSKRLVNRTVWKFHRPILRSAFALEGGTNGKLVHAHMIIAKPDDVNEEQFCSLVEDTAARNLWVMNGEFAVHIQSLSSGSEKRHSVFYTTKDGSDRLSFT